jgi:predicted nucleic acid-binding protein
VVIDASIGIQWVVQESTSSLAIALLDHSPIVPGLFYAECANVLWKKVARRELEATDANDRAQLLAAAHLRVVSDAKLFVPALELACELGHPAYDCLYLALARAEGAPLVTADLRLIERCRRSGLPWLRELVQPLGQVGG